ncbi:MAG: hypothetical protein LBL85_05265, partial [Methanocalculaceae archaeon]|nr:hypothetical protein [Methanocalculaceae archaeon]
MDPVREEVFLCVYQSVIPLVHLYEVFQSTLCRRSDVSPEFHKKKRMKVLVSSSDEDARCE